MQDTMTKRRPGYHNLSLQIPEVLWVALWREAEESGDSASKVLTRILARHYKVGKEEMPKPRKAGRPPKSTS